MTSKPQLTLSEGTRLRKEREAKEKERSRKRSEERKARKKLSKKQRAELRPGDDVVKVEAEANIARETPPEQKLGKELPTRKPITTKPIKKLIAPRVPVGTIRQGAAEVTGVERQGTTSIQQKPEIKTQFRPTVTETKIKQDPITKLRRAEESNDPGVAFFAGIGGRVVDLGKSIVKPRETAEAILITTSRAVSEPQKLIGEIKQDYTGAVGAGRLAADILLIKGIKFKGKGSSRAKVSTRETTITPIDDVATKAVTVEEGNIITPQQTKFREQPFRAETSQVSLKSDKKIGGQDVETFTATGEFQVGELITKFKEKGFTVGGKSLSIQKIDGQFPKIVITKAETTGGTFKSTTTRGFSRGEATVSRDIEAAVVSQGNIEQTILRGGSLAADTPLIKEVTSIIPKLDKKGQAVLKPPKTRQLFEVPEITAQSLPKTVAGKNFVGKTSTLRAIYFKKIKEKVVISDSAIISESDKESDKESDTIMGTAVTPIFKPAINQISFGGGKTSSGTKSKSKSRSRIDDKIITDPILETPKTSQSAKRITSIPSVPSRTKRALPFKGDFLDFKQPKKKKKKRLFSNPFDFGFVPTISGTELGVGATKGKLFTGVGLTQAPRRFR